ncbi:LacI family DNA-binding transcriptional regulator [Leifsonia sp. Root112D2]|uniref:LacI family DNA-binding transcriptional regulator n=1 Tax=Leifsonia sp. Root112D2 TaxID=1736426 RepID=UPI0006FFADC7|nr:LacI family DNA-binding transcriptional regulator [Leifsonia sp. Root112D2]KQV06459.1 LacI family transcriptional regulator [Leifsonia sp. Root112D2]
MAVTMRDVAKAASVSPATVSRALSSPKIVNPQTAEAVRQAADRLGYRLNRAARGLITGRTSIIGIIVPDLGNPFFASMVKGIQSRARAGGYSAIVSDSDEDGNAEAELIGELTGQVDGMILCSPRMSERDLHELAKEIPLVMVNRAADGIPSVVFDDEEGARQATMHLRSLGHRTLAWAGGPEASWSQGQRLRGVKIAVEETGLELLEFGPFVPRFESGIAAADLVLASQATAVLAYNDLMAMGILRRLFERGIAVPTDISVVGNDDLLFSTMGSPTLTTVALPIERAGRASVDLLLDLLTQPDSAAQMHRELPTSLLVRGSTGEAKEK